MFIVVNGFIPKDNDILGNEGRCVKVSCVPVGNYVAATKNSYRRVYNDDGSYGYPKISENIERKKGEMYWNNKTLCSTRAVKKKQYSLITAYEENIFPQMEEIVRKESCGGLYEVAFLSKRIVLVAICHRNILNSKMKNSINVVGCEETKARGRLYSMSMIIFISGS